MTEDRHNAAMAELNEFSDLLAARLAEHNNNIAELVVALLKIERIAAAASARNDKIGLSITQSEFAQIIEIGKPLIAKHRAPKKPK